MFGGRIAQRGLIAALSQNLKCPVIKNLPKRYWGIYLTQVATTCSVLDYGARVLPKVFVRVRGMLRLPGRLSQVPGSNSLAKWIRLPSLWWPRCVDDRPKPLALPDMRPTDFRYGRHHPSRDTQSFDSLVQGNVAHNQPEVWCQRPRPETGPWTWQLPNRLGVASQTSPCDGQARPRPDLLAVDPVPRPTLLGLCKGNGEDEFDTDNAELGDHNM